MSLEIGTRLKTLSGNQLTVLKMLGEGGQGWVYEVDYAGERKALKWYKRAALGNDPLAFHRNLKGNIKKGSPAPNFLWPQDLTLPYEKSFGYVMDLRPPEYYEIWQFLLCRVRFSSFKTVIEACMQVVSAFRMMHNQGYIYRDINDGNFFINPKTGDVLVCDNDNVSPSSFDSGIMGKPRYMAPEVVLGKKPNTQSDLYSLALMIYMLLCLNHPLEGKRYLVSGLTEDKKKRLYGSEALFVMDPEDQRNGPHEVVHRNSISVWGCLPDYMKDMFLKAFSRRSLLEQPSARPMEIEWLRALTRFRSEVVVCSCGNESFLNSGRPVPCDSCGKKPAVPNRLVLRDYCLPVIRDTRIYRCQLGTCNADHALDLMAVVEQKAGTGVCGIRNKSGRHWKAVKPGGEQIRIEPEKGLLAQPGTMFRIEDETIRIE